jgi:hypothetical protein
MFASAYKRGSCSMRIGFSFQLVYKYLLQLPAICNTVIQLDFSTY